MTAPLLQTKLHVPRRRRSMVARSRLSVQLNAGFDAALTLVSAPAGFGKTTVLADWLGGAGATAAWVSLDERDNDPPRFWTYAATALGSPAALDLLETPGVDLDAVLTALVNDLARAGDEGPDQPDRVLVLDDYHAITAPEVHEAVAFLVEHLPSPVHLVIATRSDPPLPLARLRASGDLVEIRAADLRFTTDEAATYLNGTMGLDLTARDVTTLEERTEGWAAALQLAALSMQGRDDVSGFIADFAGENRYIVDYLVGEVLARQTEDVRRFLLQTAVLSTLTDDLCDALTERRDSRAMLESLERSNLFLVPLDDRRHSYRYHHLFGEVLRVRLLDEAGEEVGRLHRRAAEWFEAHGATAEAIHHALAGSDFERAADLVESAAPALHQARQEATVRPWLAALPEEVFANRPVLLMTLVDDRMVQGNVDGVEELLGRVEQLLSGAEADGDASLVVVDRRQFDRLPAQIAIYRAGLAHLHGDVNATIAHGRQALALLDDDDHLGRGSASALQGLAYWTIGDLERAGRLYTDALVELEAAGFLSDTIGCTIALADIRLAQGRLRDAEAVLLHGLQLAGRGGGPPLRGAADMHVGLSGVLGKRGDLAGARTHLETARDLGDQAGLPQNPYRSRVAEARLAEATGDLDGALALLDEAEHHYFGDYSPDVRPVATVRARLRIVRGELEEAQRWADERALAPDDDLSYGREFEHLTLARLLLAQQSPDAEPFLARLAAAAEEGGRPASLIEALILQALALQGRGDIRAALALLDRALVLADPEGYARVFLDEGAPMRNLLQAAAKHGSAPDQAQRVLTATAPPAPTAAKRPSELVDPLSERELDVLRLLRSDLSGPDIARELVVSLNTVRTHTKSIYAKLGVNNRRAAVRRATELGL